MPGGWFVISQRRQATFRRPDAFARARLAERAAKLNAVHALRLQPARGLNRLLQIGNADNLRGALMNLRPILRSLKLAHD